MAKDRQMSGYIRDEDHLDFANPDHYIRARNSNDLQYEEYWYQSVYHGPSYAKVLVLEIFQKKRRNNVTNKVEINTLLSSNNSDLNNEVRVKEIRNEVKYSRIIDDSDYLNRNESTSSDTNMLLIEIVTKIVDNVTDDQLKVLAYFIVNQKIDCHLIDNQGDNEEKLATLINHIKYIWTNNINEIYSLNKYIGSKYRCDQARRNLLEIVKNIVSNKE